MIVYNGQVKNIVCKQGVVLVIKGNISLKRISQEIKSKQSFYILTHKLPDGDTLGSAYALGYALKKQGKSVKILCHDLIPDKYKFLCNKLDQNMNDFDPEMIISVDVADRDLLGDNLEEFKNKIDICIDHHISNCLYATYSFIDQEAAATAEVIYDLICEMKIDIDENIASCIYTGISTDTGCFKYRNTRVKTHFIAAKMIECGANHAYINKIMFDTHSKAHMILKGLVINSMEVYFDGKCALISITNNLKEQAQKFCDQCKIRDEDLEGLSSIPRSIEGVLVGVTMRENSDGNFKISLRTEKDINASDICSKFSGGGHAAAAG